MRTKIGTISSTAMTGTVTVVVHRQIFHSLYKKRYRRSKKYLADSATFTDLAVGDTVEISECRPLSKRKRFRIASVLSRVARVSELTEESTLEKAMHREKKKPVIAPPPQA